MESIQSNLKNVNDQSEWTLSRWVYKLGEDVVSRGLNSLLAS